MFRGEFRFESGLVVPNNITSFGARLILDATFRAEVPASFWVGLVDASPSPTRLIQECAEPTIGVNGYSRVGLNRDTTDWPNIGDVNGEQYVESKLITFEAVGGAFDKAIRRMVLMTDAIATTGNIFALSAPLPDFLTVDESTELINRQFRYRVYGR